jgi:hypothetical protein
MPLTAPTPRPGAGRWRADGRLRWVALLCLAVFLMGAESARAGSRVLVLDGSRVTEEYDRFVPDTPMTPTARAAQEPGAMPAPPPGQPTPPPPPPPPPNTVRAALAGLLGSGQISQAVHDEKLWIWETALRVRGELRGERRLGLTHAIGVVGLLAQRGELIPSRLNLAFLQLQRNAQWWSRGSRIPAPGERVRVAGSWVLFQRVPGQGLQFHPLANWGRAQAMLHHGYTSQGVAMVNELLPLGSQRGRALTWEYLFYFGRGVPPWTSGLSQGSVLVALGYAYRRTGNPAYANAIRQALTLYELPAPLGVRVRTRWGAHYAEYSYAPGYRVVNGFVQALNGLWDAWHVLGDARAAALFRAGDAEARRALPHFDTGRWSRYDNIGKLSNVHYHILLRDFLSALCGRSRIAVYCAKASRFSYYLRRFRGPPPRSRTV